jgi:hypothetical protein
LECQWSDLWQDARIALSFREFVKVMIFRQKTRENTNDAV